MEDKDLQNLWKLADKQLQDAKLLNNQSWVLQYQIFVALQEQKAKKKLWGLVLSKLLGVIFGIAYIWFIAGFLYHYFDRTAVVVSTSAIVLITGAVVVDYLIQLYLLYTLDFQASIIKTQKQLSYIETSIIRSVRISFLQLPFYTFFYINHEVISEATIRFWSFQLVFTGMFIAIALFFYLNISPKNLRKKWVKKFVDDAGGQSLRKTMEFINEIEDYQKDLGKAK